MTVPRNPCCRPLCTIYSLALVIPLHGTGQPQERLRAVGAPHVRSTRVLAHPHSRRQSAGEGHADAILASPALLLLLLLLALLRLLGV